MLMVFCLVLALVSSAFAITVADVSLDLDDAVERSNPQLEGNSNELDRDDELEYVTFNVPVTADNGDIDVTDVILTSTFTYATLTDDNADSDIFLIETSLPLTVLNGTTKTVRLSILVPSNLDAIDTSFNAVQHSVNVEVETNESTSDSSKLSFYAENGFELNDVEIITPTEDIECDVEDNSDSLDCDDEIEELSPTEDFTLKFMIENIFDSDSDLDVQDVEIELDSDNNDVKPDDDNFDEDIDAEDEVNFDVDFEVDSDVEDGDDVKVTITVFGTDDNDARHGFEYTFSADFELPDYQVELTSAILSSTTICQGDSTKVSYEVENIGGKDQNNVRVQLKSAALNINDVTDRIELEDKESRDNDYQGEFVIDTKESTKADNYGLDLIIYYRDEDSNDATIFESLDVVVQDCDQND